MSISFTNWFKKPFSKKQKDTPCNNGECLQYLELIMDGEATEDQKKIFTQHIEKCMPCYRHYQLEATIKQALQTKCCKVEVPKELIEAINIKIRQSV